MPRKSAAKRRCARLGYRVEVIDPSEESIPVDYDHSPFLPRVYRGALFSDKPETVRPPPSAPAGNSKSQKNYAAPPHNNRVAQNP